MPTPSQLGGPLLASFTQKSNSKRNGKFSPPVVSDQHTGLGRHEQPCISTLSTLFLAAPKAKGKRDGSTQGPWLLHRRCDAGSLAATPRTCQVSIRAGAGHFPHHQHERFN